MKNRYLIALYAACLGIMLCTATSYAADTESDIYEMSIDLTDPPPALRDLRTPETGMTEAESCKITEAETEAANPYAPGGAYTGLRISIKFGSKEEILDASDLALWTIETEKHEIVLDKEKLNSYVAELAETYDTQGKPRLFTNSHGDKLTITSGSFGWKLDVSGTADLLLQASKNTGLTVLEPVWENCGATFTGQNDIGDSYVEVDLTNQKVWLYIEGKLLLETDCVTGTYGTDRQTPDGVYSIFYRQSPAVLKGEDYSSPVEYWMAFNGGIGLHDANWRSTFGGDIYLYDGSHGCVNLPTEAASQIYEFAQIGFPVVCYN